MKTYKIKYQYSNGDVVSTVVVADTFQQALEKTVGDGLDEGQILSVQIRRTE